jgi:tRNA threonylcarbamoyladenosine biosynthesis protein TsaB
MSLIVSLETSVKVCSAAIHDSGQLVASSEVHIEYSHASKLAVLVHEVSRSANIQLSQLSAVAVTSGPGSYTGLRIGTSTAKGMCFSLDIPLISVGTLDLLAYQMSHRNSQKVYLCPMLDARRMEVYCQVFNPSLETIQSTEAKVIDESSFQEVLDKNQVIFFGDGAMKCKEKITHQNAHFVEGVYPSASHLGSMAFQKFAKGQFEDLLNFEPHYLKEFMIKKPNSIKE